MNRIIISILFSSIVFFVGCDNGTISNSSNDYTIENMVGTWNVISNNMDMTMAFDFNTAFLYMLDEYNCVLMGGAYEDDDGDGYGCTLSNSMISTVAPSICNQMQGELTDNICTYSIIEELCCQESESQTLTITSDGSITSISINSEGEVTNTGNISIDGTDIIWTMDNSPELTGTLSMPGNNSATFTFELDNALDALLSSDNTADQSYIDAVEAGSISITGSTTIIIEKINN